MHDPAVYPEPDTFKPERFLDKDGNLCEDSVISSIFGYGRRVCPGRHLAEVTLFIFATSLFSVFNIEKGDGASRTGASYSYTGHGLKYALFISDLGEVADSSPTDPTAAHDRSRAPSPQEIREQRN